MNGLLFVALRNGIWPYQKYQKISSPVVLCVGESAPLDWEKVFSPFGLSTTVSEKTFQSEWSRTE